jgi:hypothetical protein
MNKVQRLGFEWILRYHLNIFTVTVIRHHFQPVHNCIISPRLTTYVPRIILILIQLCLSGVEKSVVRRLYLAKVVS